MIQAIIFSAFLELGYLPANRSMLFESDYFRSKVFNELALYTDLEFRASWYGIYLGGGVRSYFCPLRDAFFFYPYRNDYRVFAGYQYSFFEIGALYQCSHPVMADFNGLNPEKVRDAGFHKIFIRFSIGGKNAE